MLLLGIVHLDIVPRHVVGSVGQSLALVLEEIERGSGG
jgi:hypothetical protein